MNALTLDEEPQPRASNDGDVMWLSDGFHRGHLRKVLDLEEIEVDVRDGSRRDALLFSLSIANTRARSRKANFCTFPAGVIGIASSSSKRSGK